MAVGLAAILGCRPDLAHAPEVEQQPQFASITGYAVNDISPPNAISAIAYTVGDRGWIAGTASDATQSYGWVRTPTGNYRMLGTLPGYPVAVPRSVNSYGDVAGELWTANGSASIAVFWPQNMPPVVIGVPGLYPVLGTDLNDNQVVVGAGVTSLTPPFVFHAYIWTYQHQQGTDLGTYGGTSARATGINSAGDIVGWLGVSSTQRYAFVHRVGQNPKQLVYGSNADGIAVGVNNTGTVMTMENNAGTGSLLGIEWNAGNTIAEKWLSAGEINAVNRNASAVLASTTQSWVHFSHGSTLALPGLPGGLGQTGFDLNGSEWVVGTARNSAGADRAILWLPYQSRD